MSVCLFGQIFPRVANKHRLQVLQHFSECIKQAKAARQEAVQMNLFTALLGGLRGLTEAKANFNQEDVQAAAVSLIIVSSNPTNFTNHFQFLQIFNFFSVFINKPQPNSPLRSR